MNGSRPSTLTIILVALLAILGGVAMLYLGALEVPLKKQMVLLICFLFLALGAFTKNKREYYLFLWLFLETSHHLGFKFFKWLFLETFASHGFKQYIPLSAEMHVYFVLDPANLLLVGLYAAWFLDKVLERRPVFFVPKDCLWALIGLWLACLLSVINAADKAYSIYHIASVLRGLLIFVYVARHAQSPRVLRGILVILMLSLALQTSLAMLQEFGRWNLGMLATKGDDSARVILNGLGVVLRVAGTYPHPNMFSALYLDFLLPVVACGFFISQWSSRIRVPLVALYLLGLISLAFTLSRGGWLAFGLGGLLFWIGLRVVRTREKCFTAGPLLLMGLVLAMVLFTNNVISSRLTTNDAGAASSRIFLMKVALHMIKAHPWLGVGAGNYLEALHLYDTIISFGLRQLHFPVHNLYLYLAAESGLPALLFFLLFVFFLFRRGWKVLRLGDPYHSFLALGLLCGLTAALTHGLTEPVSLGDYCMFWLASGLLAAQSGALSGPQAA